MSIIAKTLKSFALAAVTIGLPITAHAETRTFERNGVTYVYTASVENGRKVLTGTADRVPFRFVVRGRNVTGHFNYNQVSFTQPAAKQTNIAVR